MAPCAKATVAAGGCVDAWCLTLLLPFSLHPHAGDIVINEVLGQPANDTAELSAARDWGVIAGSVEWIELANRGSSEVRGSSCRQP